VAEDMRKKPLVHYDPKSDVIYIVLRKGPEETVIEVAPGVNVELDEQGEIIGIEILRATKFFKPIAKLLYNRIQVVSATK
jgi:uncharacterized protein YuzE